MQRKVFIFLLLLSLQQIAAQSITVLERQIELTAPYTDRDILSVLEEIEDLLDVRFSYSTSQFDPDFKVQLSTGTYTVRSLLDRVFLPYRLEVSEADPTKIILVVRPKPYRLYGHIRDRQSGETIGGTLLLNIHTDQIDYSNDVGFFSTTVTEPFTSIIIRALGYRSDTIQIVHTGEDQFIDINLEFTNLLKPIVINQKAADNLIIDPATETVRMDRVYGSKGVTGENDVIQNLRSIDGITSGSEGSLGINVNGGAPDENLIIMEGMPLYEFSHIAGLSSIFIDEAVKSVNLIKGGIPSRYGGRLSSVIHVNLKDGRKDETRNVFSLGLTGLKFGSEGPISKDKKTTYNIAGRASLINTLIKPFAKGLTNFEDISISYGDLTTKIHHQFSKYRNISVTAYLGNDRIKLFQNDTLITSTYFQANRDINNVRWGNKLVSVNYDQIFNAKTNLKLQAGYLGYNFYSRGYYELSSFSDSTSISRAIDVQSQSNIRDIQGTVDLSHYFNDNLKLRIGSGIIGHAFNPTIKQSRLFLEEGEALEVDPDSSILSSELFTFAEFNLKMGPFVYLYPGIHFNQYFVEGKSYPSLQPRFRLLVLPSQNTLFSISYSRLAQNVHLLTNPGVGIASDLWVPSTADIRPSTSDAWYLDFKQTLPKGIILNASWYQKKNQNILEYSVPVDLHANVIINKSDQIFFNNKNDWRNQVEIGEGISTGYSVSLRKESGQFRFWLSYHHNSSLRTFENLNNGESFRAKFDRPTDLAAGASIKLGNNWVTGINWVYTSGHTFSLPNEEFSSILGIKLLRPDGRNNYRLPAFQQMTITAEHYFKSFGLDAHMSFGIYNVYDQRNPFYLYITNEAGSDTPTIRKVSIFPLLPFFTISWSW